MSITIDGFEVVDSKRGRSSEVTKSYAAMLESAQSSERKQALYRVEGVVKLYNGADAKRAKNALGSWLSRMEHKGWRAVMAADRSKPDTFAIAIVAR